MRNWIVIRSSFLTDATTIQRNEDLKFQKFARNPRLDFAKLFLIRGRRWPLDAQTFGLGRLGNKVEMNVVNHLCSVEANAYKRGDHGLK